MKQIIYLFLVLTLTACIQSRRIAGGDYAERGVFAWHAKLEPFDGASRKVCGGGLIRYNWVITAGQCIYGARDVIVRLGVINRLEGPESAIFWVRNRDHLILHEDYHAEPENSIFTNDIGLIYLEGSSEAILTEYVGVISLPDDEDRSIYDHLGIITGFGLVTDGDEALQSMNLRFVDMQVISTEDCKISHGSSVITDGHFCTNTTGGRSPCVGDEGGPFFIMNGFVPLLVGVGSTPLQQCTIDKPAIFTNLLKYLGWILDNVDGPIPTPPPPPPDNGGKCNCICNCYTCPQIPEPIGNKKATINTFWKN